MTYGRTLNADLYYRSNLKDPCSYRECDMCVKSLAQSGGQVRRSRDSALVDRLDSVG